LREFAVPEGNPVPTSGNLTDDIRRNAREHPDGVGFSRRMGAAWVNITWAEFLADVTATARGLLAAGIAVGDRVAIMCKTCYEWTVVDYAIWYVGAVSVPMYDTSSTEQAEWVLRDSGAVLAVAATSSHVAQIDRLRDSLPALRLVLQLDAGDLERLIEQGKTVPDDRLEARCRRVGPKDLATLIYTSGTTGRPKGCRLTHANFVSEIDAAVGCLPELFEDADASTLLFLPLAHVFARIVQVGCVRSRVRLGHTAEVKTLLDDLGGFRPTFVLAVPRVFEKVFNTASQRAASNGRAGIFGAAVTTAIAYSRALDRSGPGLLLRARHSAFDRLVYTRLRAALGGAIRYGVSGGAPLGDRLAHFFRGIGIPVLEGYGLTETTGALTVNLPRATRIGTVGRPLPGTTVRLADDGELLFRGGQVFDGYWGDQSATDQALIDGWLHTGDIGDIDPDGYVRITGRGKEILVTAGGKNVAPGVLEDQVRAHPLVSQCMVVGDGKPYIGALITLDEAALAAWLAAKGRRGSAARLAADPDVQGEIQSAVDEANASVSRAEQIRRFAIVSPDWTEETGELTPTLKLKRSLVLHRYQDDIEALYE
jgi:long-chain acyl-CoA synthetase